MPIFELVRVAALSTLVVASAVGSAGTAFAFEKKVFDDGTSQRSNNPWEMFQHGFQAYKNGHKDEAIEAYRYAAEKGQLGATWKLARMYAQGDGVARNDYEAFKFFTEIAQLG